MRGVILAAVSFIFLTVPQAGSGAQTSRCRGALQPRQVVELIFGRDIGHRLGVGETAWTHFVAHEVTPRFPDGLTITDAYGQWRERPNGRIVREPSKLVVIVLPGHDDDQARLDAIVNAYKREFRQQSVGVVVQSACVSF
jgi:hypothetical protein